MKILSSNRMLVGLFVIAVWLCVAKHRSDEFVRLLNSVRASDESYLHARHRDSAQVQADHLQHNLKLALARIASPQQTDASQGPCKTPSWAPYPPEIVNPSWMTSRREAQLQSVGKLGVFYDFKFADRIEESGIRFRHKIVADAGKDFKLVHYDHGNGISIADVDGDGLYDIYFVSQIGGNELWKNLGGGRFENITRRAGVAVSDRVCVTASFADIDNDG